MMMNSSQTDSVQSYKSLNSRNIIQPLLNGKQTGIMP